MRYSRQELVIGKKSQELLRRSAICIVGIGALGSVSAELLTRAGIGKLILIDRDIVELTNLQRQHLFTEDDVDKLKVVQAREHLNKINSDVEIEIFPIDLNYENINILRGDLILDCTDNLETRFLINEYCVKNKLSWIYSAAVQDKGYVKVFIHGEECFKCAFKEAQNLDTCDTVGVLNTITNLVSSIQVNEAIKILTKNDFERSLIYFNIKDNNLEKIKINKRKECNVCNGKYEYLTGNKKQNVVKLCGTDIYQIKGNKINFNEIKERLSKVGKVNVNEYCLIFDRITLFKDGRALIKAKDEREAKSLYAKYIGN